MARAEPIEGEYVYIIVGAGNPADVPAIKPNYLSTDEDRRIAVQDAAVMPTIASGDTNAPTMMIAEKGAALVRADAKGLTS